MTGLCVTPLTFLLITSAIVCFIFIFQINIYIWTTCILSVQAVFFFSFFQFYLFSLSLFIFPVFSNSHPLWFFSVCMLIILILYFIYMFSVCLFLHVGNLITLCVLSCFVIIFDILVSGLSCVTTCTSATQLTDCGCRTSLCPFGYYNWLCGF